MTAVNNVRLVKTADRINVIYFRPKDSLARVTIVNLSNPKTVDPREYHIVVTTDETTMSAFECAKTSDGLIGCVFASNGPNIYRINFQEDPAAGLVQKKKFTHQLYRDNYGVKVVFNNRFFAVLTMSSERGVSQILIYKNLDQMGSNNLWAGIDLTEYTLRPPRDIDIALLDTDELLFTTNQNFPTKPYSMLKKVTLANATITPRTDKLQELAGPRLHVNFDEDALLQSSIPLSHFFLHKDERNGLDNGLSRNFWILMLVCFAIIYAGIYMLYRRENLRRTKLREEVLCNNVGNEIVV